MSKSICPLCQARNEELLWRNDLLRVIRVDDVSYPAFCRVILNRHVKEMTDLSVHERAEVMRVVFAVEAALRALLQPEKINLASLGNQVPHLHWHVIPRFPDDAHFPDPIWAAPKRTKRAYPIDGTLLARHIGQQLSVP